MPDDKKTSRQSIGVTLFAIAAATVALIPWMRNRAYVNDLLDYGLVIVGNARVAEGERPWVDFTTPLQSGFYWTNHWIERIFGDTFQAMTMGNGVAIVLALALTAFVLSKRMPPIFAVVISLVIVVGSLGQHTLVWYNAVGALALAYVSWSAAISPVLHRATFWWHALTFIALVAGGTNKLNFHLVGLAGAIAWAIRAGCLKQEKWPRVATTVVVWLLAGTAIPLALELAWTGATFAEWRHNVLEIALSSRGGHLTSLLGLDFYIKPLNLFYGPTLGPVGAIVAIWLILSAVLAWNGRNCIDRIFIFGATLFSIAGFAGIMATNHEIVYISLSAGIVILISFWLGFDLIAQPQLRRWVLTLPAVILGILMWQSAWQGQRALFGHTIVDRSTFRELKSIDGEFDYLKGTHFPPDFARDLESLATNIPPPPSKGNYPYFYSTGLEWLEEIWPAKKLPKAPILQTPVAYTVVEITRLKQAFTSPTEFTMAFGMVAWNSWPDGIDDYMSSRLTPRLIGGLIVAEIHDDSIRKRLEPYHDAIAILNGYGGNMDRQFITIQQQLWKSEAENGQAFLGSETGTGVFVFDQPTIKLRGEIIVRRMTDDLSPALEVDFSVHTAPTSSDLTAELLWEQHVELPPLETEIRIPYDLNTRNLPTQFTVEIPQHSSWKVAAGWRLPRIQHLRAELPDPPFLREPHPVTTTIDENWKQALLPAPWADKFDVVIRNGRLVDGNVELPAGGEVWLRSTEQVASIHGRISLPTPLQNGGEFVVRSLWYKGGRIEIQQQAPISDPSHDFVFKSWPAEHGGLFGILIDPSSHSGTLRFKIEDVVGVSP